jgi:hypothetical protein
MVQLVRPAKGNVPRRAYLELARQDRVRIVCQKRKLTDRYDGPDEAIDLRQTHPMARFPDAMRSIAKIARLNAWLPLSYVSLSTTFAQMPPRRGRTFHWGGGKERERRDRWLAGGWGPCRWPRLSGATYTGTASLSVQDSIPRHVNQALRGRSGLGRGDLALRKTDRAPTHTRQTQPIHNNATITPTSNSL